MTTRWRKRREHREAKVAKGGLEAARGKPAATFRLPAEEGKIFAAAGGERLAGLRRRSEQTRFLDGVTFVEGGGMHGKGYAHGFKAVDKRDWFFSCHFWCDPVMPGSLGIESMVECMEMFSISQGLTAGFACPAFFHGEGATKWKYRGQLTPKADRCDVEVHVTKVEKAGGAVTVHADGRPPPQT